MISPDLVYCVIGENNNGEEGVVISRSEFPKRGDFILWLPTAAARNLGFALFENADSLEFRKLRKKQGESK